MIFTQINFGKLINDFLENGLFLIAKFSLINIANAN